MLIIYDCHVISVCFNQITISSFRRVILKITDPVLTVAAGCHNSQDSDWGTQWSFFSFEGFKPFKFVNNIEFQACKIQKLYPPLSCKNHTLHSRWDKTNYQRQNYASNLMHKLGISCDTQWIWAGANFQQDPKDNGLKQLDSRFCFETASQASQPICLSFHTLQRFISSNEPPRCVLVRQHVSVCGTEWRWAMGQNL